MRKEFDFEQMMDRTTIFQRGPLRKDVDWLCSEDEESITSVLRGWYQAHRETGCAIDLPTE
jgi:hypothetical protein